MWLRKRPVWIEMLEDRVLLAAAVSANDFLNSISLGTSLSQGSVSTTEISNWLAYTGIRNIRDGGSTANVIAVHNATGAKVCLLANVGDVASSISAAEQLAAAGALLAIEGPNEPNNWPVTYQGQSSTGTVLTTTAVGAINNSAWYDTSYHNNGDGTRGYGPVGFTYGSSTAFVAGETTLGVLRNDLSAWVGYKFTVGSSAITVNQLGRWVVAGNSQAHMVRLATSSGTILGSVSVNTAGTTAGAFKYTSLGTPIALSANTTYYVMSQETSGGDQWYDGYYNSLPIARFQADLYAAVKADPKLAAIPVFASSDAGGSEPNNVGLQYLTIPTPLPSGVLMPAGTTYADYANCHNYVCGPPLTAPVDNNAWIAEANGASEGIVDGLYSEYGHTWWSPGYDGYTVAQLQTLPKVTTETGWQTGASVGTGGDDLTVNGAATVSKTPTTPNVLNLTDGGTNEARSAFFNTPQNITSFSTTFTFRLTSPTADGFTFTIQNNARTSVGSSGSSLGYGGMGQSVAIKFDLCNNSGEGSSSTGLYLNGAVPTNTGSLDMSGSVDLHSGHAMQVTLSYTGTTLTQAVKDTVTGGTYTHTYTGVNIPSTIGGNTGYVGFTAGTSSSTAVQNIQRWSFVAPNYQNTINFGSTFITEEQQGKLYLNLYLAAFKRGWSYTFVYESKDVYYTYGLYHRDDTPKIAASYLHNMTTILADTTSATPASLNYTIPSEPATVHDMLIQKSNGLFELAVWDDRPIGEGTDNITVDLGALYGAVKVYDPTLGTTATQTLNSISSVSLTLCDHPVIIEILLAGTPPAAAGGLTATAVSSTQIGLTWTDNSNNETGFVIERASDSGFTQNVAPVTTTAANVTSYTNTRLSPSTAYYYRVRAINLSGDAANSNVSSATTLSQSTGAVPHSAMTASTTSYHSGYPASNVLDGSSSTIWHTEWSPMANLPQSITLVLGNAYNVSKLRYLPRQDGNFNGVISAYTILVSTDGTSFTQVASGNWPIDTTEKSADFTPTTSSYVRLIATDAYGGFASAAEISVEYTNAAPVPPTRLAATAASFGQISLSWQDNSSSEAGFEIERATDPGFTQNLALVTTTAANVTSYSNTGLAHGTTHYYRVRATNAVGDSTNSNTASATTWPAAPSVVALQINDGAVQRSMITSLTIAFDQSVTLASDALTLSLRGGVIGFNTSVNRSNDGRTYTLSFSGAGIMGDSLPDGTYHLTVKASSVTDSFGQSLTGGDRRFRFHRLFGDTNGDRIVNAIDVIRFRASLNTPANYLWYLDFEGSSTIDRLDYQQLRARLARRLLV